MDKYYITTLTAEDYMKKTGDDAPFKYECMECGTVFFGRWHSSYTIGRLQCPTCKEDTDPLFIKYIGEA